MKLGKYGWFKLIPTLFLSGTSGEVNWEEKVEFEEAGEGDEGAVHEETGHADSPIQHESIESNCHVEENEGHDQESHRVLDPTRMDLHIRHVRPGYEDTLH